MRAQNALVEQAQAEKLLLLRSGEQGGLADEVAGRSEINRPGESGVERRHRFIHVLPVEVHPGFEAQCVAGAETDRLDAGVEQLLPE